MKIKTLVRTLNLLVVPLLTFWFASELVRSHVLTKDPKEAEVIGGLLASLVMLATEFALTQGPKANAQLRRWLDPRAAFEGIWLQDVLIGPQDNDLAVFSVDYESDGDTY